jgi:hypothetical protein
MRRLTRSLACVAFIACGAGFPGAATAAAPRFGECPTVGTDTGCQYLVTVTNLTTSMATDPSQPSYANNDVATHESGLATDALVGVRNSSSRPLIHLNVSGPITFEFDGDGICDNASGPVPAGCRAPSGSTACGADDGPCSFAPPPGEPAGYTDFGAPPTTPPFANGDVQNGYEGPTTWFSNVGPSPNDSGTVNFSPALAPGASTYFSLEAPPKNFPVTTSLSSRETAGGTAGATVYLPAGIKVQSHATLSGAYGVAKGTVQFQLFRNARCTGRTAGASTAELSAGTASSKPIAVGAANTYYWRITYSGDGVNAPAQTTCGGQVLVVPRHGNAGLPTTGRCVSAFTAALKVGRHRAKSALVFANGRLVGRFGGTIHVRVRRRASIAVIAGSSAHAFTGRRGPASGFVQQSRTYRPC